LHRVLKLTPITIIQPVTTDISIMPDARGPGVAGTCAGKWAAILARHSIWRGRGPNMGRTPADRPSARSLSGGITLEELSARTTVSGSFKAATTATPYGPGPDLSQAPSHSGAPEPERDGRGLAS